MKRLKKVQKIREKFNANKVKKLQKIKRAGFFYKKFGNFFDVMMRRKEKRRKK